jgi:hypothetical protein
MVIKTDKADAIVAAATSQLGKPFDSRSLKGFLSAKFPGIRDWRDPDSWFCAELVVWAFERAGYWKNPPLPWPKNRVSPTDTLLLFLTDDNFVNAGTFWEPIVGLKMEPWER